MVSLNSFDFLFLDEFVKKPHISQSDWQDHMKEATPAMLLS